MANPNEERNGHETESEFGFNTVQSSAVEKRQKNQAMQKYTFFGIVLVFVLIVAMLLVTLIGGIISNVANDDGKKDPGKGPSKEELKWKDLTVSAADTQKGPLVLVNSTHEYVFPESDEHLKEIWAAWNSHKPAIYQQSGISTYMEATALDALDAMLADFVTATGKTNVQIRSAYRNKEDQANYSTPVGFSDHHTGYGVELKYVKEGTTYSSHFSADIEVNPDSPYKWILENCHKYGFIIRYPLDKIEQTGVSDYDSYFRYVGPAHATYMKENGLCLEEYITVLKDYTQSKPLKITGADGNYYEVYCTAVSGSATIKVPANYAYTVSGTNASSLIVTINRSKTVSAETGTEAESETETTASTAVDTPAA